jgi:hypothetical protein
LIHETEDDPVEEFWPALSRRQTLEVKERPSFLSTVPLQLKLQTEYEAQESRTTDTVEEVEEPMSPGSEPMSPGMEPLSPGAETPLGSSGLPPNESFRDTSGLSLWELLRDEDAAEQWEGWIADGKW